jgi:hypothetical protein
VAITEKILSCKVSRLLTLCFMLLVSCNRQKVEPGQVQDEALRAGRSAARCPRPMIPISTTWMAAFR